MELPSQEERRSTSDIIDEALMKDAMLPSKKPSAETVADAMVDEILEGNLALEDLPPKDLPKYEEAVMRRIDQLQKVANQIRKRREN